LGDRWADVVRACQGQAIVAEASALVVFGLLGAPASYSRFATAVLDAGFAVARLYEAAWRAGWATTTIGGFTDRSVAALTGWPGFQPIVAQAFGHAAVVPSGRHRSDVVRSASWRPHGGSRRFIPGEAGTQSAGTRDVGTREWSTRAVVSRVARDPAS
jgi:nitroreductase